MKIEKDYERDSQVFHQGCNSVDGCKLCDGRSNSKQKRNFKFLRAKQVARRVLNIVLSRKVDCNLLLSGPSRYCCEFTIFLCLCVAGVARRRSPKASPSVFLFCFVHSHLAPLRSNAIFPFLNSSCALCAA